MSTNTDRLNLPLIQVAQAQKEVTHNEAIARLDTLVNLVIEDVPSATPPASPADGTAYIVGASATGDWVGYDDNIAMRVNGAWQFQPPFDGLVAWLKFFGKYFSYSSGAWRNGISNASQYQVDGQGVVGPRQAAITDATGGGTIDAEARTAITAILGALRTHGLIAT